MEIEYGPLRLQMTRWRCLGRPSTAFFMDVLMVLMVGLRLANWAMWTAALEALTLWRMRSTESRAQCGATCTRGSVVMEIPLHFFVTPFSFFQMELEAEALHGP